MRTLIRPIKSDFADRVEAKLQEMNANYDVVSQGASGGAYLVELGEVYLQDRIMGYLEALKEGLAIARFNSSDSREIG